MSARFAVLQDFARCVLGALALWITASPAGAQLSGDKISFFDGATLRGKLLSIHPAKGVEWSHPEAKEPILFKTRNIHEIRFDPLLVQSTNVQSSCIARLNNGDEIHGRLVTLDDEVASFETWFAGDVTAKRESVRSMSFVHAGLSTVYRGPTGIEGWNRGKNVAGLWRYANGALSTTNVGFLGRPLELPDKMRMAFDLEWNGPLSLMAGIHSDMVEQFSYGASGYNFSIGAGWVSLQRALSQQAGARTAMSRSFLGQAKVPALAIKNKARFEFRTDAEEAKIYLLLDGELAHTWKDLNGFLPKGEGITFYSQRNGSLLKLSNLVVSEWGGGPDEDGPGDGPIDEPLVSLANKDRFRGEVRSIREGKLGVATSKIELNVPLERVKRVYLKSPALDVSQHSPEDVRAVFADHGQVTLKLNQWTRGLLTGRHEHVGEMSLHPSWVRALTFNLHRGNPAIDAAATMEVDPHWPEDDRKEDDE